MRQIVAKDFSYLLYLPCQEFVYLRARHDHNTNVRHHQYGQLRLLPREHCRPSKIPKQSHQHAIFRIQFLVFLRHHSRHKRFVCRELLWPEVNHFRGMHDQHKWWIHPNRGQHERPNRKGMDR